MGDWLVCNSVAVSQIPLTVPVVSALTMPDDNIFLSSEDEVFLVDGHTGRILDRRFVYCQTLLASFGIGKLVSAGGHPHPLLWTPTAHSLGDPQSTGRTGPASALCVLSTTKFATGNVYGELNVCSATQPPHALAHPSEPIAALLTSDDGKYLVSASDKLRIWDTDSFNCITEVQFSSPVTALCSISATTFAAACDGIVSILDYKDCSSRVTYVHTYDIPIWSLGLVSDGVLGMPFYARGAYQVLSLWNFNSEEVTILDQLAYESIIEITNGPTKDLMILGDKKLFRYRLFSKEWECYFRFIFLAKTEPKSAFFGIPLEVVLHLVSVGLFAL